MPVILTLDMSNAKRFIADGHIICNLTQVSAEKLDIP